MEIKMFNFELMQTIYYIRDDRIHSAPVLARMIVENAHGDWTCTKEQKDMFTPFGDAREAYATCHGLVPAEVAFGSRQDLIDSLI
jgi:hypothetical protein